MATQRVLNTVSLSLALGLVALASWQIGHPETFHGTELVQVGRAVPDRVLCPFGAVPRQLVRALREWRQRRGARKPGSVLATFCGSCSNCAARPYVLVAPDAVFVRRRHA